MNLHFAADRTLGKLSKWLRILGFDTIYESDCGEKAFYAGLSPERILLTRNKKVLKQFSRGKLVFIESNHPYEQLEQVLREFNIRPEDTSPFSVCIQCNLPLLDVDKSELQGRVPDYIWISHNSFKSCPGCSKIFWPGSHTRRSLERIERLWEK